MTTLQMKNRLIRKIKSVNNPELLEEFSRFLDLEFENIEKLIVPAQVKKSIIQGQKDIKEGRYLTNKEADEDITRWLKK